MKKELKSKSGETFTFRELEDSDGILLGRFFESLSADTRSKFGPHPLTPEHALILCGNIGRDNTARFIVQGNSEIVGYFILDFNNYEHDAERYRHYGIELNPLTDPVFAPCIADEFQNKGIAGSAMNAILEYAESRNLRRIILMGGTQERNSVARSFYAKSGFKEYGRFYTEHNGLNNIDMMLSLKA